MLYQWEVDQKSVREIVEAMSHLQESSEDARRFARELVEGTLRRLSEIDALLSEHSDEWRVERMAAVDRNILRLATYEFLETDAPKKVAINEALEIAKRFSAPDAIGFVNGVLDAVCASIEGASEAK